MKGKTGFRLFSSAYVFLSLSQIRLMFTLTALDTK